MDTLAHASRKSHHVFPGNQVVQMTDQASYPVTQLAHRTTVILQLNTDTTCRHKF